MDYKAQYQEYLLQATAALDAASDRFLPEESEVCRAARYSLLGGGKRIRAILTLSVCDMLGGEMQAAAQRMCSQLPQKPRSATRHRPALPWTR